MWLFEADIFSKRMYFPLQGICQSGYGEFCLKAPSRTRKPVHRNQQIKKQADKAKDHWLVEFVIYVLFMHIQWFVKGASQNENGTIRN